MKTDLTQYIIDAKGIHNDRHGKDAAIYELGENQTEMTVSYIKLGLMFAAFVVPYLFGIFLIGFLAMVWGNSFRTQGAVLLYIIFSIGWVVAGIPGVLIAFFDDSVERGSKNGKKVKSPYVEHRARLEKLWARRKELNRFVNVDAAAYENSQAREIAPFLLARIRKHNFLVSQGAKMIDFQRSLEINSPNKKAGEYEAALRRTVQKEYADLKSKIETYEIMKDLRSDQSMELAAAMMNVEDFNKSDLDSMLREKADAMGFMLESVGDEKSLTS